jgi:3-methyladenine DNA glycosylase AlkD
MVDPVQTEHHRSVLKTQLPLLGVAVVHVKEIAGEFLKSQHQPLSLTAAIPTIQGLWQNGHLEARLLSLLILRQFEKQFDDEIWQLANTWLNEIDDWSLCDTLCVCVTGPMVAADLSKIEELIDWARSENLWRRRASLVSLRRLRHQNQAHAEIVFRLCEHLMQDPEWAVRKALGFTLRDLAPDAPDALTEFLKRWKPKTHRSIIREATKKLPPGLRQSVLSV